jgi:hypothetical protein
LQNPIQRLLVMCDGERIDLPDLARTMRHAFRNPACSGRALTRVESDKRAMDD